MAKTHGMRQSSEYRSWSHMKDRCSNPNHKQHSDYGGRGIAVCDRWLNSFENFLADMGLKPTLKHSIDRIDNDGNYQADNCKWSTRVEQANNQRSNHLITIDGKTLTISQWTKEMGFGNQIIHGRLKMGWSDYEAVMTPVQTVKLITIGNKTLTIAQWENEMGYGENVICQRLGRGWSEFDAVMTPTARLIKIGSKVLTIAQWTKEMGFTEKVISIRLSRGWSEFDAVMTPVRQRKTA